MCKYTNVRSIVRPDTQLCGYYAINVTLLPNVAVFCYKDERFYFFLLEGFKRAITRQSAFERF